ncbi:uncharacterized protein Triagg1_3618 [Trichoderma aggressivum f. europaeum]|uniref:Ankyrin repeat protein n=1 Tax=Trichoderma aggressivum f. europaeum TaxID=173218 RepID=A0AAE1M178_9HYPO|nr:hypothetical protein Triagg1_3618 [Trichoderma aggressivum f. europaeum]
MSATMSVQRLTQRCLDKFQKAIVRKGNTQNQRLLGERLAGFNLWADNIRDITKPGASLDSGVQSRPDELKLAKNILKILDSSIDRHVDAVDKGLPTEEALASIDSAIANLAKIGVAIRRASKESRNAGERQETDETSNSDTEDEFANNSYFEDKRSAGSLSRQNARGGSSIFRYILAQDKTNDPEQITRDLNAAVSRGDGDAVRSLVKSCRNFDTDGKIRKRAFRAAVQRGHIAIVGQLLGNGADVDSCDEHGQTALFFAIERNDKAMVQYLIESGIDVHIKDYEDLTALHIAVRKGDKRIISTLFTTSVYQRFTDDQFQKAISWAEKQGHLSAAKLLRYESILSHAQRTFDIKDRTAASKSVIQGNDWYALLDPLLVPLHFDLVGTFPHDKKIGKIAFSRDGKYIATSDKNRTVQIFDVKTRRNVFRRDLKPSRGDPPPVCFSSDGRYLLFGSLKYIEVSKPSAESQIQTLRQTSKFRNMIWKGSPQDATVVILPLLSLHLMSQKMAVAQHPAVAMVLFAFAQRTEKVVPFPREQDVYPGLRCLQIVGSSLHVAMMVMPMSGT